MTRKSTRAAAAPVLRSKRCTLCANEIITAVETLESGLQRQVLLDAEPIDDGGKWRLVLRRGLAFVERPRAHEVDALFQTHAATCQRSRPRCVGAT